MGRGVNAGVNKNKQIKKQLLGNHHDVCVCELNINKSVLKLDYSIYESEWDQMLSTDKAQKGSNFGQFFISFVIEQFLIL